jgi:hypothetical protein
VSQGGRSSGGAPGGPGGAPGGGGQGGGGPAANAGVRGALLLAAAVILGVVLLQKFDTGIDTGGRVSTGAAAASTTTTRRVGLTTVPVVTTTTLKARAKADVKVVVANGAGVRGLGAATTNALKNLGYATLAPTDTTGAVDKTTIQFADGYETDAREVASALTLPATVVTKFSSPPVAATDIVDAKVIVILGADVGTSTTSTTVAGAAATTSTTRR